MCFNLDVFDFAFLSNIKSILRCPTNLDFCSELLNFIFGVSNSNKFTVSYVLETVARRANVLVNFPASSYTEIQ